MRKLLFASFLFVGTLTAQTDSSKVTSRQTESTTTNDFFRNEMAIANFFPMIFQQTWSGNMGALYRYHIKKHNAAIRLQINGNINNSNRTAVINDDYVNKVPDEFNILKSTFSTWNIGLGFQHGLMKNAKNSFSIYHFIDVFMGSTYYGQMSMAGYNFINGTNGKTLLYFNTYENKQTATSMSMNFGLGLNFHIYKNIHAQLETSISGSLNTSEYANRSQTVSYDISSNSFYVSSMNENKTPKVSGSVMSLTPASTLYLSYRF